MHISELEDLQVSALDSIQSEFKGAKDILEEEVIAKAATNVSIDISELINYFQPGSKKNEAAKKKVISKLHNILKWVSICAFVLKVDCPLIQDLEDQEGGDWPDEVLQCGVLASMAIQNKISEFTLDYFLVEQSEMRASEENLLDIITLVDILAQRLGITFKEVLVS